MRAHNTYRSERRNDWRKLNGVTWLEHNRRDHTDEYGVGSETATYWQSGAVARSKYQPHIGKKERGRYAA